MDYGRLEQSRLEEKQVKYVPSNGREEYIEEKMVEWNRDKLKGQGREEKTRGCP